MNYVCKNVLSGSLESVLKLLQSLIRSRNFAESIRTKFKSSIYISRKCTQKALSPVMSEKEAALPFVKNKREIFNKKVGYL